MKEQIYKLLELVDLLENDDSPENKQKVLSQIEQVKYEVENG
jgi:hypothetical protein